MSRFRWTVTLVLAAVLAPSAAALAQRRAKPVAPGEEGNVPIAVALTAGTTQHAFTGRGACEATEQASIYGVPASLSTARYQEGARGVALTLWQPKNGTPEMIALTVSLGGKSHRVSTVKVGQQGEVEGSGTARLDRQGAGGLFAIDARAVDGTRIKGTIRCDSFAAPMPAGG